MNQQIDNNTKRSPTSGAALRTVLWSMLVISAAGNSVASLGGSGHLFVHIALGIVSAVSVAGLIADRLRARS